MPRPAEFQQPNVTLQRISYLLRMDDSDGGVLDRGQIVWTREPDASRKSPMETLGFVEGIGVISINPRGLVPADILRDSRQQEPSQLAH